jgi:PadR family transcriptional regulator, regulatory protein PadR
VVALIGSLDTEGGLAAIEETAAYEQTAAADEGTAAREGTAADRDAAVGNEAGTAERTEGLSATASLPKFHKELSAGIVSLVLLALLERADEPLYGYQIAKSLESASGDGLPLKQGTLYPVLRSLEAGALLASRVEPSVSGPPRRYYSITTLGREALPLWVHAWVRTKELVDAALEGKVG